MKNKFKIIVLCLTAILLLSACGQGASTKKESLGYYDNNEWGMSPEEIKEKYPDCDVEDDGIYLDVKSFWGIEGADAFMCKLSFKDDKLYDVELLFLTDLDEGSGIFTQIRQKLIELYGPDVLRVWTTEKSIIELKSSFAISLRYRDIQYADDEIYVPLIEPKPLPDSMPDLPLSFQTIEAVASCLKEENSCTLVGDPVLTLVAPKEDWDDAILTFRFKLSNGEVHGANTYAGIMTVRDWTEDEYMDFIELYPEIQNLQSDPNASAERKEAAQKFTFKVISGSDLATCIGCDYEPGN